MRSYVPRQGEIVRDWWVVDAAGKTLGRVATAVSRRLTGKAKPTYTPFLDTGDHVIVLNASTVVLTGRKLEQKLYRRHSGYPGGLREIVAGRMMKERPTRVVELAVRGMLPKGPLGRQMYRKLKVYAGPDHPHTAQKPKSMEIS